MLPLDGYHVLDLSLLLPGPLATQILRDLGAKVTKIEPPGAGDLIQHWPPIIGKTSAIYLALNRGKHREIVDLKDSVGLKQFESMVREADVVVEGFRPGVLERLRIGYDRLSELNPKIVLCSITGYGQNGPYSQRAGHDIGYQAMAGVLSLTSGDRAVSANCPPLPAIPQLQVADTAAGAYAAAMLILAALIERQQTGRGRHVDVSMSEQLLPLMTATFASASANNADPKCNAEVLTGGAPCYRIYRTSDGLCITLGALEPKFWQAVVEILCVPELAMAPYLGGPGSDELAEKLAKLFASKTRKQWEDLFAEVDACFEPVLSISEVSQHAHWIARNSFTHLPSAEGRHVNVPKMPASLAGFDTEENQLSN